MCLLHGIFNIYRAVGGIPWLYPRWGCPWHWDSLQGLPHCNTGMINCINVYLSCHDMSVVRVSVDLTAGPLLWSCHQPGAVARLAAAKLSGTQGWHKLSIWPRDCMKIQTNANLIMSKISKGKEIKKGLHKSQFWSKFRLRLCKLSVFYSSYLHDKINMMRSFLK